MWRDHQRNKAIKRAVGVGVGSDREGGNRKKLKKKGGGRQYGVALHRMGGGGGRTPMGYGLLIKGLSATQVLSYEVSCLVALL